MKIIPHQDHYGAKLICSAIWADEPVQTVVNVYWWRIFKIYDFLPLSQKLIAIPNTFGIRYNYLSSQSLYKLKTLKDKSSYSRDLVYPIDVSAWQTRLDSAMIFVECEYSIIQQTLESYFPGFYFIYWNEMWNT